VLLYYSFVSVFDILMVKQGHLKQNDRVFMIISHFFAACNAFFGDVRIIASKAKLLCRFTVTGYGAWAQIMVCCCSDGRPVPEAQ